MDSKAAIDITDVVKVFRDFWRRPKVRAVDGLSLTVRPGEIFGLLGPNGSGKSTTIKMLLGLLHADAGVIRVLGRAPRDIKTKQRIGYLPEDTYLYPYLTPSETLDFYGKLFDLVPLERRRRSAQLLDMVDLAQAAHRPVGEFSKGMARRIGLAQALVNDPQLIILDEPTSGLDPVGCRQVKDLMLALARRGKTILLSSHLLADVEDVCDRIAILYNGRIRAHGSVKTLLQKTDSLCMTLPVLPPKEMMRLLKAARKIVGADPSVHQPSVTLEQFFLNVVADAHRAAPFRSGASSSDRLADFLTGEPAVSGQGAGRP